MKPEEKFSETKLGLDADMRRKAAEVDQAIEALEKEDEASIERKKMMRENLKKKFSRFKALAAERGVDLQSTKKLRKEKVEELLGKAPGNGQDDTTE